MTVVTIVNCGGSVTVTVADALQPALSVTVYVYVPAINPVADVVLPPDGAHELVYGGDPPIFVASAAPSFPPKQETFWVTTAAVCTPTELPWNPIAGDAVPIPA